jgi:Domain of unknown function (DUF1983)
MTITSDIRETEPFIGNDVASVFAFEFKVFRAEDILVFRVNSAENTAQSLVLETDFRVVLNPNQNSNPGGSIRLIKRVATPEGPEVVDDPLPSGFRLVITSQLGYVQPTDLTNQGGFYPRVITDALDRLTIFIQQLLSRITRSIQLPLWVTGVDATLPPPEPNKIIAWNGLADGLQNVDPSLLATLVAFGTAEADIFSGDGSSTDFLMTRSPGTLNNLDVSIAGSTKRPGIDYTWPTGTTLRFTEAPPEGTENVLVRYMRGLPQADNPVIDPAYLLDLLNGQITESELFSGLGERIDLIDTNSVGSVNERLAQQADTLNSNISSAVATVAADAAAAIFDESETRAAADSALASQITTIQSEVDGNTAAIQSEATTRANADSALSTQITTLQSSVAGNTSAIQTEATTRANADSALSTQINTVQATANGNTTAIQTEATARANADGALFAQYTVKIDSGGKVAGYGLASTANNTGNSSSEFAIRADRFYVAAPAGVGGLSDVIPFIVVTAPFVLNGVTVPAGVYIEDAFIRNGSIASAKIGNAAITNAKIADATIDNAKIANLNAGKINAGTLNTARLNIDGLKLENVGGILTVNGQQIVQIASAGGNSLTQYQPPGTTTLIPSNFFFPVLAKAGSIITVLLYLRASDDIGNRAYMYGSVVAKIFNDSARRYPLSSFTSPSQTSIILYDQNIVQEPAFGRFCYWVQPISLVAQVTGENWVHVEVSATTHTGFNASPSLSHHNWVAQAFASS